MYCNLLRILDVFDDPLKSITKVAMLRPVVLVRDLVSVHQTSETDGCKSENDLIHSISKGERENLLNKSRRDRPNRLSHAKHHHRHSGHPPMRASVCTSREADLSELIGPLLRLRKNNVRREE